MRNTFPKFVVFTLLVLMGGFYFNPSVVSAAASCDLTVSVNNATGNVTVSGTVNETRPGVDTSGTSASISDSALAGSDNANNGDSSFVEYTVHFNDGAYTAYLDGTAISYPNDPTPENNTCHTEKNFTVGSYDIISSAGTGCSISPLGTTTKPYGSSQSYSIYSLAGYEINTVRVDGALVGVPSPYTSLDYTFSNITADHTIVAECKLIPITGTLLPSPAPCSIPAGSDSCPVTLTWTTSPLTATAQIVDSLGTIFGTGASGSKTIAIFYTSSPKTFYLKNNSITLAQSTATASCEAGYDWDVTTATCKLPPGEKADLTIRDPIIPTTAIAGSSKTFSANIINISDVSTSGPITHLFQFDNDIDHNAVNATRTATSSDIIANGTVIVSTPYTFSLAGDRYARACADKRDALDTNGTIPESDEGNNCGPWTKITVAAGVVNGSCAVPEIHYACDDGTSTNNVSGSTAWTWTCTGSGSGATNDLCSENKYINLKAATPPSTQSTATVGVPRTFTSVITNYGNIPTGASFPVIFQTSPTSNFSSDVNTYRISPDMSALNAGAGATATSPSITFSTAGTMYVQACADKDSATDTGVITESNEGDNCSGPRAVSVTGTTAPDLTVTDPITPTTATAGASQTYSATIRNIGDASASGTINHLFQFDEDADHALVSDAVVTTSTTTISVPNGSVPISAPYTFASSGTKYVRVCADNNAGFEGAIAESSESNNCHDENSWTTVEVSAPPEQPSSEPDLVSGNVTPYNAIIDEPQTFSVIIQNNGGTQVPGGVIHIFQYDEDTNHTLGVINTEVTSTSAIPALGGSVQLTNAHTFSSLGTKYVRACADNNSGGPEDDGSAGTVAESNEGNNCSPALGWTSVTVSLPSCEGPECGGSGGEAGDGGWSDWSYNGVINGCSATCDNEIGYQVRTCTEPTPSGGGKICTELTLAEGGDEWGYYRECLGTQACSAEQLVPKNGICAPKHNFCALGGLTSPVVPGIQPTDRWIWTCTGVNSGGDSDCSEIQKLPGYIED